jgi:hypothetical protein
MGIARNTQCCCARAVYSSQFCRRVDYTTPRYNPDDRVAWSHNASRPNRATSIDTCVVGEAGAYILASLFTLAFFNRFEAHFSGPTLPLPQNGPLTSLFSVSQIGPFLKFPPVLKQRLRVLFLQASELRIARTTRKEYPRPSTVCCSEYGAGRDKPGGGEKDLGAQDQGRFRSPRISSTGCDATSRTDATSTTDANPTEDEISVSTGLPQ